MGREIRLIRALADEGYQYALNDGVPPIPRDRMVTFTSLPKHLAQPAHGRDRGGRRPGRHAPRRRPDEPRRRPRLRPARAGLDRGARRASATTPRATRTSATPTRWREAFIAEHGVDPAARATREGAPPADDRARRSGSTARSSARSGRAWSSCSASGRTTRRPSADDLARKAAELRIFRDDEGRTNRSLLDVGGAALVVSQFTLYADTRRAAGRGSPARRHPDLAERLYLRLRGGAARRSASSVATGRFGAEMAVELVNDGPFTIWLDTDER